MDSYQFYHLYHSNVDAFMSSVENLRECDDNLLIALKNVIINTDLVRNKKLRDVCFSKVLELIKIDENHSNFLLDEVLEAILWHSFELPDSEQLFCDKNQLDVPRLRVLRAFVTRKEQNVEFSLKIAELLVDGLFCESSVHPHIVGLLKMMMKNEEVKVKILKLIYENCKSNFDLLSLQNLCYFFDKICELKLIEFNDSQLIKKYFDVNTKLSRKQGIFIIKNLIEHSHLDGIESWKIFTIIIENLQENPSHLILPTLELMTQIKVDQNFHYFWFFLCQSITSHDNNLVKCWGLKYLLNLDNQKFEEAEILQILKALNSTSLFDDAQLIENIQKFIFNHFEIIFEQLINVEWTSVAFYHILEAISDHVKSMSSISSIFMANLRKQSEIIPRKISNRSIRGGVQILFTKILEHIIKLTGFVQMLPTVVSVFKITSNNSSIDNCLRYVQRDDHEFIFNEKFPHDFLKYALGKLYVERDLSEMRQALKKIKNPHRLLMEVICELNEKVDGYEDDPNELIHEIIHAIFKAVNDGNSSQLLEHLEVLEIGMHAVKSEIEQGCLDHLIEIWRLVDEHRCESAESEEKLKFNHIYWKVLALISKHHKDFDSTIVENEINSNCDKNLPFSLIVECQIYSTRNISVEVVQKSIKNIESLIETSKCDKELKVLLEFINSLSQSVTLDVACDEDIGRDIQSMMEGVAGLFKELGRHNIDFWEKFLATSSNFATKSSNLRASMNFLLNSFLDESHDNEKFELLKAGLNLATKDESFVLLESIKERLTKQIFEADVMAREVQIEFTLGCKLDKSLREKLEFRLDVAKFLSQNHPEDFNSLMEKKIQRHLTTLSKKKPRYYTNSQFHRQKMHLLQPIALLNEISDLSIESLIYELSQVNNQLNITYFLEIILAQFCPDILSRVKNQIATFKAPPLKSIFSIAVMQIRRLKDFDEAETKLAEIFDLIFPFAMGQNFGVRSYAIVSLILSLEHVKSLPDFISTQQVTKISEICELMVKSVQNKNAMKYFEALREDFRFVKDFEELLSVESFYWRIPAITNMPFEEIIGHDDELMSFKAADITKSLDDQILNDELEVPVDESRNVESAINLQQKYLPYKFKIPGDNLLRSLPSAFKFYDETEMTLKPKSDLVVVASLIEHSNNLGGLARSCEIFGVSNYVINSLKMTENLDFKSLSKTAEKWIKITEIKSFQVMDYLLGMKRAGYAIVGAEQTGNSTSLINAKIPKKTVLLLGNEKEGIPANLLSLLDLTIEIPQIGVVRSLNVHVTASILLWEYAKQNLLK